MSALLAAVLLFAGQFPIGTAKVSPVPFNGTNVRIAANGEQSLAVWFDTRISGAAPRVRGTFVDRNGEALEPQSFSIGAMTATNVRGWSLDVATNGRGFLVAWTNAERRVATAAAGRPAVEHELFASEVVVAGAADAYILFYVDFLQPSTVKGLVLDAEGRVLVAPRVLIESDGGPTELAAASNGSHVAIAWAERRDGRVHHHEFAVADLLAGRAVAPPQVPGAGPYLAMPYGVAISSAGGGFNVAWVETIAPGHAEYQVRCAGGGDVVRVARTPTQARPRISGDILVYNEDPAYDVRAAHVCGSAIRQLAAPPSRTRDFDVAGDTLVRADPAVSATPIGTTRDVALSNGLVDRSRVQAAPLGQHFIATWLENGRRAMYGRFTVNGRQLDGPGVRLGSSDFAEGAPSIASDGHGALIAWQDTSSLHVAFASPITGRVERVLAVETGALQTERPDVHWNGEQYLVVWSPPLHAMRFDRNGRPLDEQPVLLSPAAFTSIDIGWTGSHYVIAGAVYSQVCHPVCDLYGSIQTATADLQPAGFNTFGTLRGAPLRIRAGDGDSAALVLWSSAGTTRYLFARADGTLIPPIHLLPGAATFSDVVRTEHGWDVLDGPYLWRVGSGTPERITAWPYVPAGAESIRIDGGLFPLLIHRDTTGEAAELVGHFLVPPRRRAVR